MAAPNRVVKPILRLPVRTASLRSFASREIRTILVTGPGPVDKPATTDRLSPGAWESLPVCGPGFAAAIAAELARTDSDRVLVVETGRTRPDAHDPLSHPARRGLRELLNDSYLGDLTRVRTARFGLGDWIEILGAQQKSGDLVAVEEGRTFRMRFLRGSLRSISGPTSEHQGDGSPPALRAMASELVLRIAAMKEPECRFISRTGPPPWAAGSWVPAAASCLDEVFRGPLADRLRRPFLAWEIAVHMADTPLPNVKRIPGGRGGALSSAVRRPLRFLLERLGRGFAHVLLDVPSPARTGPAGMIAGLADAALVVATPAEADSPAVMRAVDELRMAGATTVGVALHRPGLPFTTAAAS